MLNIAMYTGWISPLFPNDMECNEDLPTLYQPLRLPNFIHF